MFLRFTAVFVSTFIAVFGVSLKAQTKGNVANTLYVSAIYIYSAVSARKVQY